MNSSPSSLRELFNNLKPDGNVTAVEAPTWLERLKESGSNVEWSAALPEFTETVAELLEVKLSTFFLAAWKKLEEVKVALAESAAKPEETTTLQLVDYATDATFEPSIEVRVGGVKPGMKMVLTVTLPLTFKGVILTIQHGQITKAKSGEVQVDGQLALGQLTLVKLKQPVTVPLGPAFAFEPRAGDLG